MSGNRVTFAYSLDDQVSKGLDLINKRFKQSNTQASLLGNVGAMAVAKGFSLIDTAASGAVSVLGDAVKAAMDDQASIAMLDASLKANVKGWDGNRTAIEGVLKARMALGFSDDEQRKSLSTLLIATHDQNKALDVQRVAMDLARLKGISLAEAGDALTKVEAGSFRILKSLGIELRKGATQTDALAAVERAAAGQAEAYAKTNEGRLLVSQVKIGEAMENIGYKIMPAVSDAFDTTAAAVEGFVAIIDLLGGKLPTTQDGFDQITTTLNSLNPGTWMFSNALNAVNQSADDLAKQGLSSLAAGAQMAESRFGGVTDQFTETANTIETKNKDIVSSFVDTRSALEDITAGFGESVYGPLIAKEELLALQAEDRALRQKRAAKGTTKEEKAQIDLQLNQDYQKELGMLGHLAAIGDANAKMLLRRRAEEIIADKNSSAENRKWAQGVLVQLGRVEQGYVDIYHSAQKSMSVNPFQWINKFGGGAKAAGGPVDANTAYIVGEAGPEVFVPNSAGDIIPNSGISMKSGGGGGTVVLNVNLLQIPSVSEQQRFAQTLVPSLVREIRRQRITI